MGGKKKGQAKAHAHEHGEDCDHDHDGDDSQGPIDLSTLAASNPGLLAALQAQLGGFVGASSGYVESLPKEVKKRVNALKNLQSKAAELEVQFQKEVLELEKKYEALNQPLLSKRAAIIAGDYEPTEEESTYKNEDEEDEDEEEEGGAAEKKEGEGEEKKEEAEEPAKGIPCFWSTVLQSNQYTSEMIEEHDVPVLELLRDIRIENLPSPNTGFALHFTFGPNPYFKNEVLTKKYFLDYEGSKGQLVFDGPTYVRAEGCAIEWLEGKDVTVKMEKKKQKKKSGKDAGKTRTVTKMVKQPSFFHFFNPPKPLGEEEEADDDEKEVQEALLSTDFEIGDIIKDKILPCAVLWFTGEATMGDDDEYDEGEEEGDGEEGEEEDEEDDGDYQPPAKPAKGGPGGAPQNPECKQQ